MSRKYKYPTTIDGKNTRLYTVYRNMISRCNNPNNIAYHHYGGRGITVCEEWLDNWDNFAEWSIDTGYDATAGYGECTIDRIDNSKGYSPDNCRWVDMKAQGRNRRTNVKIGETCVADYADSVNINRSTMYARVSNGFEICAPVESKVFVEGKSLKEISAECGVSLGALRYRYYSLACRTIKDLVKDRDVGLRASLSSSSSRVMGKTLLEISREYNTPLCLVKNRYRSGHRSIEELTAPKRENMHNVNSKIAVDGVTLSDISREFNISYQTIYQRYKNGARTIDELIKPSRGAK